MSIDESDAHYNAAHRTQSLYRLPKGARQIIFVRHGSSTGATEEIFDLNGLIISNPPLTAAGHAQAEALVNIIGREKIDAMFVSPLQRTQQTAAPLAAALNMAPAIINDLREVHMGDWEHSFYQNAAAGHPIAIRIFAEESWEIIPNAETFEAVHARLRSAVAAICAAIPEGGTAVAFSHAGIIAEACRRATDSRPFAFTAPDNSSVSRIVIQADGSWKLRSYNDISHLGYAEIE